MGSAINALCAGELGLNASRLCEEDGSGDLAIGLIVPLRGRRLTREKLSCNYINLVLQSFLENVE